MELPTKITKAKTVNPGIMLLYGPHKVGKTEICSQLPNHFIMQLEPRGSDCVDAVSMDINGPKLFNEVLSTLEAATTKLYDYLIVDTMTKLDEWSSMVGTYNYMSKSAGKKFNRDDKGVLIPYGDVRFEDVNTLPNGYGYIHSRNAVLNWYDRIEAIHAKGIVTHVILLAHIKDKYTTNETDEVNTKAINMTGKLPDILCSRVDAVCAFYRKGKEGALNFDNDYKIVSGSRSKHLDGEIIISEKLENNDIKTFWERVYLK